MINTSKEDDKLKLAFDLKEKGNQCFNEKRYHKAIDYYTQALDENVNSIILSNRAQAFYNLNRFFEAYTDANEAVLKDPCNLKALYRRAIALNKLGLYMKAKADLAICLKRNPKNDSARKLLNSIKKNEDQKIINVYNFCKPESIQSQKKLKKINITILENKKTEKELQCDFNYQKKTEFLINEETKNKQYEIENSQSLVLPGPANSYNKFIQAWVELQNDPIKFAAYFLTLEIEKYNVLFDEIIDLDILPKLIHGLYNSEINTPKILSAFYQFSKTARFSLCLAFLDKSTISELRCVIERFSPTSEVIEIKKMYFNE